MRVFCRKSAGKAGLVAAAVLAASLLDGCRSCETREHGSFPSEEDYPTAKLSLRKCGADEGWVVTVESRAGKSRDVFEGRTPKGIPVDGLADAVWVAWRTPKILAISVPSWARIDRQEARADGIRIEYRVGWIPFPGKQE